MWLVLWAEGRAGDRRDLALAPDRHRSEGVWHAEVGGLAPPFEWAWRVERPASVGGPPADADRLLLDPHVRVVTGGERWGGPARERRGAMLPAMEDRRAGGADPPPRAPVDEVIYEVCVRGFTAHPSSGVATPGTFRGLVEKVPYLAGLGVTTVELLPVAEWDELEVRVRDPVSGEPLRNLWGYSPLVFSAPKAGLASSEAPGAALVELRALVDALHAAGIRVLLDVVFNHTAERDLLPGDPLVSLAGIDPETYYLRDPATGRFRNDTGCGNTVAANRAPAAALVLDALRFWASEVGVDGFRFDLAAVLVRGEDGEPIANPELLRAIEDDAALARCDLVAEPWDAAGVYLLGGFAHRTAGRWREWNDRFREDVRHFVRGEPGRTAALAARLAGSEDVFGGRPLGPGHSINYVICHDGFTLADLVAYDRKHNERNGEGNRDGSDWNASWNCGVEGPTSDPAVLALRRRQVRNLLTLLFVAQGVPMLLAGDERGRTLQGNNNAWCQDNEISWVDWAHGDEGLLRFTRGLVAFRRAHPVLRRRTFLRGAAKDEVGNARPDVAWHGVELGKADFGPSALSLAMHLAGERAPEHSGHPDGRPDDDVYLAANASSEPARFELPAPPAGRRWLRVVATWEEPPGDFDEPGSEPVVAVTHAVVPAHATLLLRSG